MLNPIFLSLKIAGIATLFSLGIGLFCAYFLNKRNVPGKHLLETVLTLPMILPPSVMGYLLLVGLGRRSWFGGFLYEYFGIQIIFTQVGAVIAACVVSLPLMYQSVKSAFLNIDPVYESAAQTLGSSEWRIFWTILLPMAWPGVVSGIVLAFARAIGEFGATLMVAGNIPGKTQTMSVAIYYAVEAGDKQMANVLVGVMTGLCFVLIFGLNAWLKKKNFNVMNR